MQWSAGPHGGFTTAEKPIRPVITGGPFGYENVNVAKQQRDRDSLWRWLTAMIRVRTECPEIGWGECRVLTSRTPGVLALEHRWRGTAVVCVHNFAAEPRELTLRPRADRLVSLSESDDSRADADGVHRLSLEPYDYRWYRAETPSSKSRHTRS